MSRLSIPYVAGFFDGEGGCFLRIYWYGESYTVQQRVYFSNTNRDVLEKIHIFLREKYGLKFRLHEHKSKKKPNHTPQFMLECSDCSDVMKFLELVLPYLIVKKDKAQLLYEFCSERLKYNLLLTERAMKIYEEYKAKYLKHFERTGRPRKSVDKEKVLDYLEKGLSVSSIAKILGVSYKTVKRRLKE